VQFGELHWFNVINTWSEAGLTDSPTWSVELLMPSCLDIFT